MKQVRFHAIGGPEVLSVDDVEPAPPGPGEVRIRTHALALNRADVMFRTGNHFAVPTFPQAQGLEAAGVVEALGPDVTSLAIGDRVSVVPAFGLTDYTLHGELVLAPARAVVRHPARLSWEEAAALWMSYSTAYGALIDIAGVDRDDFVIVCAASSSVGLAAIQTTLRVGARPIALTRTTDKRDALLEAGAAAVIATDTEDVPARILELTDGAGADVIFDPVAGPGLTDLLTATARYAKVIIYGALASEPTELSLLALLERRLTIRGYDVVEVIGDNDRLARAISFITDGVDAGDLTPAIDATFALADIAKAYAHLESNSHVGKVVITVVNGDR